MATNPVTKTDLVRQALGRGDAAGALRLAKGFRLGLTSDERAALQRAHECQDQGKARFYRDLGQDPTANISEGLAVLRRLVGV